MPAWRHVRIIGSVIVGRDVHDGARDVVVVSKRSKLWKMRPMNSWVVSAKVPRRKRRKRAAVKEDRMRMGICPRCPFGSVGVDVAGWLV